MPNHQTSQDDPLADLRTGVRLDAEGMRSLLQRGKIVMMLTEIRHAASLLRSAGGNQIFQGIQQRHDEVLRLCMNRCRGHVLKSANGRALAAFQEPLDAVKCAAEIQQAFEKNPVPTPTGRLELGIAVHVGTFMIQEDSARKQAGLSGQDLEVTASMGRVAHSNQVLLTEPVAMAVVEKCALLGLRLHSHGGVALRGVGERFVFELLWGDHQPRRPAEEMPETRVTRPPISHTTQAAPAAAPQTDPLVGATLGGCKVLERIDSGGMATVYKGEQTALRRCVALKVMKPELLQEDPSFVTRFRREAHLAAQLDHPNTVLVYDQGEQSGYYYIVMQFVDGSSLAKLIHNRGRLRVSESLKILMEATKGLATAHRLKMVHRDIKPGNILITRQGVVKLSDFGLARTVSDRSPLTSTGVAVGTPQYMSPEQCRGEKTDIRSDIYSLGATLFEMLTGRTLYSGESAMQIMYHQVHSPIPRVVTVEAGFPPAVVALLARMLAKDPRQRFQTPDELSHELRSILSQIKPDPKLSPLPLPSLQPAADRSRPPVGVQVGPSPKPPATQQQFYWKLAAAGVAVCVLLFLLGLACFAVFRLTANPASDPAQQQNSSNSPTGPGVTQQPAPRDEQGNIERKLDSIRIPRIEFREANIVDAVAFLADQARAVDEQQGSGHGVNIVLGGDQAGAGSGAAAANPNAPSITLNLADVPLRDALRYITDIAGMKFIVDKHAVLIVPTTYTAPTSAPSQSADSALLRQFQQQQAEAALLAQTGRLRKAKDAYEKARAIGAMMTPKPPGYETLARRIAECDTQLTVPIPTWAKLSAEQIQAAKQDGVRPAIEVELAPGTKTRMVYVPAGTFWMGNEDSSDRNTRDERPRHQVTLSKGFYIGMTEITQREWKAVTNKNPSKYEGDDRPVERVSWIDCLTFIHQINSRGQGLCEFRLPTEAEWEYCCRAGSTTPYPWGVNKLDVPRYGNVGDQSIKRVFPNAEPLNFNDGHAVTAPVASYEPNRWGLYDMIGNVLEWCQDCYDENYYQNSPSRDPAGPSRGASRVMRGAAWNSTTSVIHSSYRQFGSPDANREYLGLRLAMTVPE